MITEQEITILFIYIVIFFLNVKSAKWNLQILLIVYYF